MSLPIDDVLKESTEYYRQLKTELVGRILINEKGSIRKKIIKGNEYFYHRKYQDGEIIDNYINSENEKFVEDFKKGIEIRKHSINELRKAKSALKKLGFSKKEIYMENFSEIVGKVISEFEKAGLWEEGLELIGSWCFKVYQVHCGVEYFPLRTLDVDIAIPTPYEGSPVDMSGLLRRLGFEEARNYADGSTRFRNADFAIEFLSHKNGSREHREKTHERDLNIVPVAVRYLNILLENSFIVEARDMGKVALPSMPAFFLHKLLVSDVRKNMAKKEKDYIQAAAVAKVIISDADLVAQTKRVGAGLHKKWKSKILSSANKMSDSHPKASDAVEAILTKIGWK